jgi:hypothetical protein
MNIKIFIAAAVAALTAACAPNTETVEVAAGPEAEAAFNAANTTEDTEVIADSQATPQAVSK